MSFALAVSLRRCSRRMMAPAMSAGRQWQSTTATNSRKEDFDESPPLPLNTDSSESPSPLMDRIDKNVFQRMYDKYSIKQQTNRILVAESFLQAATCQASDPRWVFSGRIARDFRSYQALLTMHVWFLHKRLISEVEDPHRAALIQEELFDILWTDSSNRMRAHGVAELLINKNLKTVQQYTFMHCFHYDHCYAELIDNPQERLEELKLLVNTHILLLDPQDQKSLDFHDDQATRIAWYIEAQYQNIVHDMPKEFFEKARIAWVDLPDFTKLKDDKGKELEEVEIDPNDILPENWLRNIANDGTYFYWNTKTREARWERPNHG